MILESRFIATYQFISIPHTHTHRSYTAVIGLRTYTKTSLGLVFNYRQGVTPGRFLQCVDRFSDKLNSSSCKIGMTEREKNNLLVLVINNSAKIITQMYLFFMLNILYVKCLYVLLYMFLPPQGKMYSVLAVSPEQKPKHKLSGYYKPPSTRGSDRCISERILPVW